MKRMFYAVLLFLTCVTLCSFAPINSNKENNSLQNSTNSVRVVRLEASNSGKAGATKNKEKDEMDTIIEQILDELRTITPDGIPTDVDSLVGAVGIGEVVNYLLSAVGGGISGNGSFYLFLGIALLFCLAEVLSEDMGESASAVRAGTALILSAPILGEARELIVSVGESISAGSEFFAGVIPILSSVAALGAGGATSGSAVATMSFSLSFVSQILAKNLFPAATLIFVASLLSSIDTGQGISGVARGIRNWFNFLIGIASLIIVATLGVQTLVTVSSDSFAVRSARYAISGMIPIVGGTVSGALTMLISGVKLLSGSIGAVSVISLLSIMGIPLIELLLYRLCIGACVILTSFSGASFGERFFSGLKGALDCLIAVLSSSLLVFILEIIILTAGLGSIA